MNLQEFISENNQALVITCSELRLEIAKTPNVYFTPCNALAAEEELESVAEQVEKKQPDKVIVLGHAPCELMFNTLMGGQHSKISVETQLYLDDIFRSVICQAHAKPKEVMHQVGIENVREQKAKLQERFQNLPVYGAWLNATGEVESIKALPLVK